jgi:hypothetical protein
LSYSFHEDCQGLIEGLYLPPYVWGVLMREGIITLDQLSTAADQIHWIPGLGGRTARMIRAELTRIQRRDRGQVKTAAYGDGDRTEGHFSRTGKIKKFRGRHQIWQINQTIL